MIAWIGQGVNTKRTDSQGRFEELPFFIVSNNSRFGPISDPSRGERRGYRGSQAIGASIGYRVYAEELEGVMAMKAEPQDASSKNASQAGKEYARSGTNAPWYKGWDLTEEEREVYRERSRSSREARLRSDTGGAEDARHEINVPKLDPLSLMPRMSCSELTAISLFSGGGGLDLGFDLAGIQHTASYELLDFAASTLRANRPDWTIYGGALGDVTAINWKPYRGKVDVVHGGPPCQPFSTAGLQRGEQDVRDMFPELVRAVLEILPRAFLAENVRGLQAKKFSSYVEGVILRPLSARYTIKVFTLDAASFGVPQARRRLFFVGLRTDLDDKQYTPPKPTHTWDHLVSRRGRSPDQTPLFEALDVGSTQRCMGVREALGLPDIGYDALAPTIRSTLTGPRHTTSILSSTHARTAWERLEIWPNGVALTREKAQRFPSKNDHFRLSVPDCAIMQGFPETWSFDGPVYKALGQIGNAVAPPVAYWLALSIRHALSARAARTSSRKRPA